MTRPTRSYYGRWRRDDDDDDDDQTDRFDLCHSVYVDPPRPSRRPSTKRARLHFELKRRQQRNRALRHVRIQTTHPQISLAPRLWNPTPSRMGEKVKRIIDLIRSSKRLVSQSKWDDYLLVCGATYNKYRETYTALDVALLSAVYNFYLKLQNLMAYRRKRTVSEDDIQLVIRTAYPVHHAYM